MAAIESASHTSQDCCYLCNKLGRGLRRHISSQSFKVLDQLTLITGSVPSESDGITNFVCQTCYSKLVALSKYEREIQNRPNKLQTTKNNLVMCLRENSIKIKQDSSDSKCILHFQSPPEKLTIKTELDTNSCANGEMKTGFNFKNQQVLNKNEISDQIVENRLITEPIAKCIICNVQLPPGQRRSIFKQTFDIMSQLIFVLGYEPRKDDGFQKYIGIPCYRKLVSIARIDNDVETEKLLIGKANLVKCLKKTFHSKKQTMYKNFPSSVFHMKILDPNYDIKNKDNADHQATKTLVDVSIQNITKTSIPTSMPIRNLNKRTCKPDEEDDKLISPKKVFISTSSLQEKLHHTSTVQQIRRIPTRKLLPAPPRSHAQTLLQISTNEIPENKHLSTHVSKIRKLLPVSNVLQLLQASTTGTPQLQIPSSQIAITRTPFPVQFTHNNQVTTDILAPIIVPVSNCPDNHQLLHSTSTASPQLASFSQQATITDISCLSPVCQQQGSVSVGNSCIHDQLLTSLTPLNKVPASPQQATVPRSPFPVQLTQNKIYHSSTEILAPIIISASNTSKQTLRSGIPQIQVSEQGPLKTTGAPHPISDFEQMLTLSMSLCPSANNSKVTVCNSKTMSIHPPTITTDTNQNAAPISEQFQSNQFHCGRFLVKQAPVSMQSNFLTLSNNLQTVQQPMSVHLPITSTSSTNNTRLTLQPPEITNQNAMAVLTHLVSPTPSMSSIIGSSVQLNSKPGEKSGIVAEGNQTQLITPATQTQIYQPIQTETANTIYQPPQNVLIVQQNSDGNIVTSVPPQTEVIYRPVITSAPIKNINNSLSIENEEITTRLMTENSVKMSFYDSKKIRTKYVKDENWITFLKGIVTGASLKTMVKKLYGIPELAKELHKLVLHELESQCDTLCSVTFNSILRRTSSDDLKKLQFQHITEEIHQEAPLLKSVLDITTKKCSDWNQGIAAAILLKNRNPHVNAVHHVVARILQKGNARNETIQAMAEMGLSVKLHTLRNHLKSYEDTFNNKEIQSKNKSTHPVSQKLQPCVLEERTESADNSESDSIPDMSQEYNDGKHEEHDRNRQSANLEEQSYSTDEEADDDDVFLKELGVGLSDGDVDNWSECESDLLDLSSDFNSLQKQLKQRKTKN